MITVELSPEEQEEVWRFVVEIKQKKDRDGQGCRPLDMPKGSNADFRAEYLGYCSEKAVAKLLDVSWEKFSRIGGDKGYDLIWRGLTIQVKHTYFKGGDLIVERTYKRERMRCDIYILAHGTPNGILLSAIIGGKEIDARKKIKNYGSGDCVIVSQKDMREFTLKNLTDLAEELMSKKNINVNVNTL